MYNLLVSSNEDSWNGNPWQIEIARCVREYTDTEITMHFGELNAAAIVELKRFPCIFAYEAPNKKSPLFGVLRNVAKRQGEVRIEYEIQPVDPFLTAEGLSTCSFDLAALTSSRRFPAPPATRLRPRARR
jgi:hypothetical protein